MAGRIWQAKETHDLKGSRPKISSGIETARTAGAPFGPRDREGRVTRLLDSAADLFMKSKGEAIGVDEIAANAGLAKSTFYHYFPDRAALLSALRQRYSKRLADRATIAIKQQDAGNLYDRLNAWIEATVHELICCRSIQTIVYVPSSESWTYSFISEPIVLILAEIIKEVEDDRSSKGEDPRSTALCLFHAARGLVGESLALGWSEDMAVGWIKTFFRNVLSLKE